MAALPYMTMYWGDYLGDTLHLTTEQHGAYLLIMAAYWNRGKSIPVNQLPAISRLNERWTDVEPMLNEFFTIDDSGCWRHNRIEVELQKAREKVAKAKAAGKASAAKRAQNQQDSNGRSTSVPTFVDSGLPHKSNQSDPDPSPDPDPSLKPDPSSNLDPCPNADGHSAHQLTTDTIFKTGNDWKKYFMDTHGYSLDEVKGKKATAMYLDWIKQNASVGDAEKAMERAFASLNTLPNTPVYLKNPMNDILNESANEVIKKTKQRSDNAALVEQMFGSGTSNGSTVIEGETA